MRRVSLYSAGILQWILLAVLLVGCGPGSTDQAVQSPEGGVLVVGESLKILETQVAMTFPADTRIIAATDGGGRDPSSGYYAWVVFTHHEFKLPIKYTNGYPYLKMPLEVSIKSLSTHIHGKKVLEPREAFLSDWTNAGYNVSGTVVRTKSGDYLHIVRFLRRNK